MAAHIYMSEITVGLEEGDRVTISLEDIKKVEVDLEANAAIATLANEETIEITAEQAVLLIHYNNIWRPL